MSNNTESSIRKANMHDLDALAILFNSYREFYEQPSDQDGARAFLKERMGRHEAVLFLATRDQQPVGFVQLYPSYSSISMRRIWILNDMFVSAPFRKKGIGAQLLETVLNFAKQSSAKSVVLETAPSNNSARGLYEKFGFVRDTEFLHYSAQVGG